MTDLLEVGKDRSAAEEALRRDTVKFVVGSRYCCSTYTT